MIVQQFLGILSRKGKKKLPIFLIAFTSYISAKVLTMTLSWDSFLCTMAVDYQLSPAQSQIFRSRFSEIYRTLSESEFYDIAENELQTPRETYKKHLTEIYKKLEEGCENLKEKKVDKSKILIAWLRTEYSRKNIQPEMDWETVCLQMLDIHANSYQNSLNFKEIYIPPNLSRQITTEDNINNSELINLEEFYESLMLEEPSKCLLLGDKGIGKSTFLYQFGLYLFKKKQGYPFYLSLQQIKNKSLNYYLIENWLREANSFFPHLVLSSEHLLNLFKQGKVWLLIDGIGNNKHSFSLLDTFLKGWITEANILVASYPNILQKQNISSSWFNTYYLALFNEQQIEAFIREWFVNDKAEWGDKLLENLNQAQYSSLRELIKHPQNLTDLCSGWENKNRKPSIIPKNTPIGQRLKYSFIYWKLKFLFWEKS